MQTLAKLLWVLIVLPLLADCPLPDRLGRWASTSARVLAGTEEPAAESGHGAWCRPPAHGPLYLGRDFPEGTTYSEFRDWCRDGGGEVGWSG